MPRRPVPRTSSTPGSPSNVTRRPPRSGPSGLRRGARPPGGNPCGGGVVEACGVAHADRGEGLGNELRPARPQARAPRGPADPATSATATSRAAASTAGRRSRQARGRPRVFAAAGNAGAAPAVWGGRGGGCRFRRPVRGGGGRRRVRPWPCGSRPAVGVAVLPWSGVASGAGFGGRWAVRRCGGGVPTLRSGWRGGTCAASVLPSVDGVRRRSCGETGAAAERGVGRAVRLFRGRAGGPAGRRGRAAPAGRAGRRARPAWR